MRVGFKHIIISLVVLHCSVWAKKADLVVFSYDRPMQLYALLESANMYIDGLGDMQVIYRTSNERYAAAYEQMQQDFRSVRFIKQGMHPEQDFKSLTKQAAFGSLNEYVLFAVDDNIVKEFINIAQSIDLMEKNNAYGFFFRLGKNLTECYSGNCAQSVPPLTMVDNGVFAWTFAQGQHDWAYPHTVDMTLYKKQDIATMLHAFDYANPNMLESHWAGVGYKVMHRIGLCHATTKIVGVPLNRVQNSFANRCMKGITTDQLLELFEQGFKIDIHDLYKVCNYGAHMEYMPHFVQRLRPEAQDGSKHFVIVAASYNNKDWYKQDASKRWKGHLDSIFAQQYNNYHVIYIDDCSPDGTGKLVEEYIKEKGMQDRVTLIKNSTRYGAMENQYRAIHTCKDSNVIVILDADDAFAHDHVLAFLNHIYSSGDTWLTYGQFAEYPSGTEGFCCPMPAEVVRNNGFRDFSHGPSHLRTFYAGLFNQIKQEDLMYEGEFLQMTCDIAAMFPMIEMARKGHFQFIPQVLCIYNGANSLNDHKVSKTLQRQLDLVIRGRNRYEPALSYIRN